MLLEIKTAEELVDPALERRWAARRDARQAEVLRWILQAFVERGGPVWTSAITAAFSERPAATVRATVEALDAEDLMQVTGDAVVIAYPFSSAPTPFVVRLVGGVMVWVETRRDGQRRISTSL
jgi:hypothetical protein